MEFDIITEKAKTAKPKRRNIEELLRNRSPQPLRPEGRRKWKTTFLAFGLLVFSLVFYSIGWHRWADESFWDVLPLFVMGTLLMIPGGFYTGIIVCITLGLPGFDYDMVPNFDDE